MANVFLFSFPEIITIFFVFRGRYVKQFLSKAKFEICFVLVNFGFEKSIVLLTLLFQKTENKTRKKLLKNQDSACMVVLLYCTCNNQSK